MLIPIRLLEKLWRIHPSGVLHVGAHLGEESEEYDLFEWGKVSGIHWVEGQKELVEQLRTRFKGSNNAVYEGIVWHRSGETLTFNISNNSQSSSVFEFGSHSSDYPEVVFQSERKVTTTTISELLPLEVVFDFVNLDIQGAELSALKGLGTKIKGVKWVYTEVNSKEVYKGCAIVSDIDSYLTDLGFTRVCTVWVKGAGWGDALYIHQSAKPNAIFIAYKSSIVKLSLTVRTFMRRILKLLKIIRNHFRG
jgi:FkbM family methyltransferase